MTVWTRSGKNILPTCARSIMALVNGPFSVILDSNKGLLAINDRLKLRSLTAATKGNRAYFASEESAIRVICPHPEKVWSVSGAGAGVYSTGTGKGGRR